MSDEGEKILVLERAIRVLDCFTRERPELGVREVARRLEISSSAAGRLMAALKGMGILSQNPVSKAYLLGPRVLIWAGTYLATSDIRNIALPYLEELHQRTQETISLYILDGAERVCIERLESTQNVRFVAPRVGRRLPLHAGSAGKLLLAFMSEDRCEEILSSSHMEPLTQKTIVDLPVLRAELRGIRQDGYAISYGEWILDASGVAAPVFDRNGDITAAITISGPGQRFTPETIQSYIEPLLETSGRISRELGYNGEARLVRMHA